MTLPAAVIRSQLVALEAKYALERRCAAARKLLDLCHQKQDELAMALRMQWRLRGAHCASRLITTAEE